MLRGKERSKSSIEREIAQATKEYYNKFSENIKKSEFTINQMEQLMLLHQKKILKILAEEKGD